jgi:hypothetical protein
LIIMAMNKITKLTIGNQAVGARSHLISLLHDIPHHSST